MAQHSTDQEREELIKQYNILEEQIKCLREYEENFDSEDELKLVGSGSEDYSKYLSELDEKLSKAAVTNMSK